MTAREHTEPKSRHRGEAEGEKPPHAPHQGIVRDERGQEQPVDKERAQQTSKSE